MRDRVYGKVIAAAMITAMSGMLMAGCGSQGAAPESAVTEEAVETTEEATTENIDDTEAATTATPDKVDESTEGESEEIAAGTYFKKGVYANYTKETESEDKTYFYVFSEDWYGYTEDGTTGIGLPFDVTEEGDTVRFTFGGKEEAESVLKIASSEDGKVTGAFEDGIEQIWELLPDVDPKSFSAENYVNGPENSVYHDGLGWNIKYDANKFTVTPQNGQVFIVYQGEGAGTNCITVTYTVENGGEGAIKALGESWGSDKTTYSEGIFPGTEDVKGYWATLPPAEEGSGLYETAVGRDFLEGALIFELTGHNSGDEEKDMEVSDEMAAIIDSLTFTDYEQ
ncbi:hypothetical protein [Butyrivibrio sp. XPD2002]|uniref:hypothetical protein n=1 Tax=Butyrivibrio sp. XPD2002 TaxID=1280665 RepID=UPI0004104892|nr:hypothetical protein [Butyrivibrio sp. XPD2002]